MAVKRQLALTLLGLLLLVEAGLVSASGSTTEDFSRELVWNSQILVRSLL
jgi:hypothetical protein